MSKLYPYFFEADKEIEDDVDVFIFLSGRSTGKTTNILDYVALQCSEHDKEFVYLDTMDSIANTKNRRDGIFEHNAHIEVLYDMQKFWFKKTKTSASKNASKPERFDLNAIKGSLAGHYQILANFSDYKSGNYDKVDWIVLDEASDKISEYGSKFTKDFINLVSTDIRLRSAKIVFAGNVDNADNEFFRNLGIENEFIAANYNKPTYFEKEGIKFKVLVFDNQYIVKPKDLENSFAEKLGKSFGHDINSIEVSYDVTDTNVIPIEESDSAIKIEGNNEVVYLNNNHFYNKFEGLITDTIVIDILDGDLSSIKFRQSFLDGGQIYYTYQNRATKSLVKRIIK